MKRSLCFSLVLGVSVVLVLFFVRAFEAGPAYADGGGGQGAGVTGNGDLSGDLIVDLSDSVYLLLHLFRGGPDPVPCPGAGAGAGIGGGSTLPTTGTTECYENGSPIACSSPSCPGQDGFYVVGCANNENRFRVDGDGTVTDNCTGLTWEQDTAETNGIPGITDTPAAML